MIKRRNTITSRRECFGTVQDIFLLWEHFHVKPNYNKNKLRKEQGNWGVLLETFPCPAVFLPKAGMSILGKEMRMLRMSSLLGQQERHPTMSCFLFCCSIPRSMLLDFVKMHTGLPKRALWTDKSEKCWLSSQLVSLMQDPWEPLISQCAL